MAAYRSLDNAAIPSNVNLHCAQCDSQIGIFENEWIRLTSSYARLKENGLHFGTEVGTRTQVVPSGPAQRPAEGCQMAEVFCRKCSNMVGQYCKEAPDAEKQSLVDQYFYKLSRTYLKDSRTRAKADPVFGYSNDVVRSKSSRPSMVPRPSLAPSSRWAHTPLRQSSSTPVSSIRTADRHPAKRSSQDLSTNMSYTAGDEQQPIWGEIQTLREELSNQQVLLLEQSKKISSQKVRINNQDNRLKEQDASIEDHENCLSAQANRIVEQDELIKQQTQMLEDQHLQLSKVTDQLLKLQKTMDDLKSTLLGSKQIHIQGSFQSERSGQNTETNTVTMSVPGDANGLETSSIRENKAVAPGLGTLADTTNTSNDLATITVTGARVIQTLGKRKRHSRASRNSGLPPDVSIVSQETDTTPVQEVVEQMPTPQSSDTGQQSPKPNGNHQSNRRICRSVRARKKGSVNTSDMASEVQSVDAHAKFAVVDDNPVQPESGSTGVSQSQELITNKQQGLPLTEQMDVEFTATQHSSSPRHVEITDTDNMSEAAEAETAEPRRITRAVAKAAHVADHCTEVTTVPTEVQPLPPGSPVLLTPSDPLPPSNSDHENVLSQESLPSVQVASNILGMDLETLKASFQALAQKLECPTEVLDSILGRGQDVSNVVTQTDGPRKRKGYSRIKFISENKVCELYDVIDTSDDDDEIIKSDAKLYGDDIMDGDSSDVHLWDDLDMDDLDISTAVAREDRSMAPEPYRRRKPSAIVKKTYVVDLDRMHLATPQMFAEAYVAGRRPKAVRPPLLQARERELNEELMRLGLSEWIGKTKNCKEYRQAVTAARARSRNLNKAAYLRSRGLNFDPSEPSSTLPEDLMPVAMNDSPTDNEHLLPPTMPEAQTSRDGVVVVVADNANDTVVDENYPADLEEASTCEPRITRARTRRNSVPLVSGLEEVEARIAKTTTKVTSGRRKSGGRRKSQRKSVDIVSRQLMNSGIATSLDNEDPAPDVPLVPDRTNARYEHDETAEISDLTASLSADMTTTVAEVPIGSERNAADAALSQQNHKSVDDSSRTHPSPKQVLVNSDSKSTLDSTAPDKGVPTLSHEARLQQHEEMILLRDRLAKELMECEDFDV